MMTSNLAFRKKILSEARSLAKQWHVSKSDMHFHFLTFAHISLYGSASVNTKTLGLKKKFYFTMSIN